VALTPEYGLGLASAEKENVLGVFNLTDNHLVKTIPAGTDPDAIIYDESCTRPMASAR